jgi:hypothetical protein
MPIKNYTTNKRASESVAIIQNSLISHGAVGIQMMYDPDQRISSFAFALPLNDRKNLSFQLPCEWRKFKQVLINQGVDIFKERMKPKAFHKWSDSEQAYWIRKEDERKSKQDEVAYNIAWANLKDWVLAQMALYETQIVTIPQIFLPFVVGKGGKTLYENIENNNFLLGDGK